MVVRQASPKPGKVPRRLSVGLCMSALTVVLLLLWAAKPTREAIASLASVDLPEVLSIPTFMVLLVGWPFIGLRFLHLAAQESALSGWAKFWACVAALPLALVLFVGLGVTLVTLTVGAVWLFTSAVV